MASALAQLKVRLHRGLKRRLDAACKVSGRSQSQEIEMRLERTFWLDDMLKAKLVCELPEMTASAQHSKQDG